MKQKIEGPIKNHWLLKKIAKKYFVEMCLNACNTNENITVTVFIQEVNKVTNSPNIVVIVYKDAPSSICCE